MTIKNQTTELTDYQQDLLIENCMFLEEICKKYEGQGVEKNDLLDEAQWTMVQCARRYEPNRGSSFKTYMTHRVEGALKNLIDKELHPLAHQEDGERVEGKVFSLEYAYEMGDNSVLLVEMIADTSSEEVDWKEHKADVYKRVLSCLTEEERELIVKRYSDEKAFKRLRRTPRYKGMSDEAFGRMVRRIIGKMRRYANKEGISL